MFDSIHKEDQEQVNSAQDRIAQACIQVAQDHGIEPLKALEQAAQPQMALLKVA